MLANVSAALLALAPRASLENLNLDRDWRAIGFLQPVRLNPADVITAAFVAAAVAVRVGPASPAEVKIAAANPTGAAWTALAEMTRTSPLAPTVTPRLAKNSRRCQRPFPATAGEQIVIRSRGSAGNVTSFTETISDFRWRRRYLFEYDQKQLEIGDATRKSPRKSARVILQPRSNLGEGVYKAKSSESSARNTEGLKTGTLGGNSVQRGEADPPMGDPPETPPHPMPFRLISALARFFMVSYRSDCSRHLDSAAGLPLFTLPAARPVNSNHKWAGSAITRLPS
jgi:hypothetical protein